MTPLLACYYIFLHNSRHIKLPVVDAHGIKFTRLNLKYNVLIYIATNKKVNQCIIFQVNCIPWASSIGNFICLELCRNIYIFYVHSQLLNIAIAEPEIYSVENFLLAGPKEILLTPNFSKFTVHAYFYFCIFQCTHTRYNSPSVSTVEVENVW